MPLIVSARPVRGRLRMRHGDIADSGVGVGLGLAPFRTGYRCGLVRLAKRRTAPRAWPHAATTTSSLPLAGSRHDRHLGVTVRPTVRVYPPPAKLSR